MSRKTISRSFTVSTVEDGQSAPYYFQEWYAWSNDATTASVTTAPVIGGTWQTSIPAQGSYSYLWRKSVRYVWNSNSRTYSAETAQYFRMSGTNGTSIAVKGSVSTISNLPSTHSNGDAWVVEEDGHLYMWSSESGSWVDLGQFQGEPGKTYYTHIAWATNVTYSGSTVTAVTGFVTAKSPNDTTHLWMGVLVDENSGQDSEHATLYTWSYTKGVNGTNVITADLDNEMDGIQTDEKGKVLAATTITTSARIYNGQTPVTSGVTAANATLCGVTATPSLSGGVATYSWIIPNTFTFTNGKATVTLTLTYGGNNYTVVFTLMATMGSAVYNLTPSPSVICVGRTDGGGYSPSAVTLTCGCTKSVSGSTSSVTTTSDIDGAYRVFFRRRARSGQTWSNYYWYGNATYRAYLTNLDVSTYDQVDFVLYKNTSSASLSSLTESLIVDRESVPVTADGEKGSKGDKGDKGDNGDPGTPGTNGVSPYSLTPKYMTIPIQCEAGGVTSDAMTNYEVEITLRQGTTRKAINSISGYAVTVENEGSKTYPTSTVALSAASDKLKLTVPIGTSKTDIAPSIVVSVKSGTTVIATCNISLPIAQKGLPGDTEATVGVLRYYNGEWDSGKTYYYTDTTAPIVKYGNSYYAMKDTAAARAGVSGNTYIPTNSTYWTEVSYRAAEWMEMLFANFARLGSAVFYSLYMFSAYGSFKVNSNIVENVPYDDPDVIPEISSTIGPGTDFSSCAWEPYFWVNLSTGKVYMQDAVIRGLITEWFQTVKDNSSTPQTILLNGDEAHHVTFESHNAPKALLLPMLSDVSGISQNSQNVTLSAFNGAGASVRVVNQTVWMSNQASQQDFADQAVLVCADPRMFVNGSYAYVNGSYQYAPLGTNAGDIIPDYDGYFAWNGILAKFILLPPGYMVRLTSLDNYIAEAGRNCRYWFVEGAFDIASVGMSVDVLLRNGSTAGIVYTGEISPGPRHGGFTPAFLSPDWMITGNTRPQSLPKITVNLQTGAIEASLFYVS